MFDNPMFENYVTNYMEETQSKINDSITFEQFKTIQWEKGVPYFIIDFLGYMTGHKDMVEKYFEDVTDIIHGKATEDLNRFISKNPFNMKENDKKTFNEIYTKQSHNDD